jgi:hypothetical protein
MSSPLSSFSWKIISILFYIFGSKASSNHWRIYVRSPKMGLFFVIILMIIINWSRYKWCLVVTSDNINMWLQFRFCAIELKYDEFSKSIFLSICTQHQAIQIYLCRDLRGLIRWQRNGEAHSVDIRLLIASKICRCYFINKYFKIYLILLKFCSYSFGVC